ncbi:MAG: hypothetical protein R3B48_07955 [Kofleriaceae bacterium]
MSFRATQPVVVLARRCIAALVVVALVAAPATAEPQWATDLRAKAEGWKRDLRAALGRLDRAAKEAGDRLAADAKRRLDELLAMLEAYAGAVEDLLADRAAELEALAAARAEQALAIAQALERELAEVIAGTRRQLTVDVTRLATGSREVVEGALREAGVRLQDVRLIDGRLVAEATAQAEASARRWGWALAGLGGVVVLALGLGLVWPRKRAGDGRARRWIVTVVGVIVVAGGGALAWYGATRFWSSGSGDPVVLALARCDALDRPAPASPSERARWVRDLARCQLTAADRTTAAVIAAALTRALSPPAPGGPP